MTPRSLPASPRDVTALSGPLRIALVGAGRITEECHLPAVLGSANARLVALVDPAVERAAALARHFGIAPMVAADVQEVLGGIDAAVIATPNHTHRPVAVACLGAGVSTLVEKPLAGTYEDAEAIVAAGEASGAVVAVGYATRFRESTVLLRELLDRGFFGRVHRFAHQFGSNGGWAPVSAYNLDRRTTGGGVLVVTGTHFLDRMLDLWGYPSEVELADDSQGGPEASCIATFRYPTFTGVAVYSKTVPLPGGLVIETDRGTVLLADTDRAEIVLRPTTMSGVEEIVRHSRPVSAAPALSTFALQLEDFIAACRDRRPPRVDGNQGLMSVRLLRDLYARRRPLDSDWYAGAEVTAS